MIKETDGDAFETLCSLNQDLTFEAAERIFKRKSIVFGESQKRTLELINKAGQYTNLALILSDQCPYQIKAATFAGSAPDQFHDRKVFSGSVLQQLEDACAYLDLRNQMRTQIDGLYRTDSADYDAASLREALINAIVHRDYANPASTLISVFKDRAEFMSYGGIAGGASLAEIMRGLSICRNRRLASVFYRLEFIEAYGTGLRRILKAYAGCKNQPDFIPGPVSFKVILPNLNESQSRGILHHAEDKKMIVREDAKIDSALQLIRDRDQVTRSDIERHLSVSPASSIRLIQKMREAGLIKVVGKGKATKYRLAD